MARETRTAEAVREAVAPALAAIGVDLYDLEIVGTGGAGGAGRTLRVIVDREGGIDLDHVAEASHVIANLDDDLLPGEFELEVSSPGVERPLRTPEHFRRAVGSTVSVKAHTPEGPRRVRGALVGVDEAGCTIEADGETHSIEYQDITAAHTVFEWGPAPRPRGPKAKGAANGERSKEKARS